MVSRFQISSSEIQSARPDLVAAALRASKTNEHGVIVRPVAAGDEARIAAILDKPWAKEEAAGLVKASLDPEKKTGGWVAVFEGQPVGIITTKDEFNGSVVVDSKYRGRRIGEALVTAREEHQKAQGQHQAMAHIMADNASSIKLHNRMGYLHQPELDRQTEGGVVQTYQKNFTTAVAAPSIKQKMSL